MIAVSDGVAAATSGTEDCVAPGTSIACFADAADAAAVNEARDRGRQHGGGDPTVRRPFFVSVARGLQRFAAAEVQARFGSVHTCDAARHTERGADGARVNGPACVECLGQRDKCKRAHGAQCSDVTDVDSETLSGSGSSVLGTWRSSPLDSQAPRLYRCTKRQMSDT